MKPYTLATILVKVLGLSVTIGGISYISSLISTIFFMTAQTGMPKGMDMFRSILSNMAPHAIVSLGCGKRHTADRIDIFGS